MPLLLVGAMACQEPFAVNRKDLGPFRIAAVGVEEGVARAAIWSGEGAWHEVAPALAWTLDGQPLGEGWEVAVPGEGTLGLVVTAPDGDEHEATVTVSEPPPVFDLARYAVTLGQDLSLDARRAAPAVLVETTAAADQAMRLSLSWSEDVDTEALSTRWMSAGGLGTLLEVEPFAADLLAEEVTFEDGEVLSREATGPGIYTQLALVKDGAGGNRWSWIDAAIGVEATLVRHEDRLLALEADTATGLVAVTLEESEDLWGLAPTDPQAVADLSQQQALSCAPSGQAFRLAWIVEGRCPRPELLGARVVLELR